MSPLDWNEKQVQRFHAKVERRGPNDCWPWKASRRNNGYGALCYGRDGRKVSYQAHVVAKILDVGRDLKHAEQVNHHCDVKTCCNPAHLYIGTREDNMRDAIERGRLNAICLTDDQVQLVRALYRKGSSFPEIARSVGCAQSTARRIALGIGRLDVPA